MQIYIEIVIVILLLVLVFERFFGDKVRVKQTSKEIKKKALKDKKAFSIIGETKHLSKVQEAVENNSLPTVEKEDETIKAIITNEELDEVFSDTESLEFTDEEEEFQSIISSNTDNDFATGLSYEELQKIPQLIEKRELTKENVSLAMKLSDTDLLDSLNEQIPEAQQRVSELLNRYLDKSKTKNDDWESFDIREFV